jgi:hypothetical protein
VKRWIDSSFAQRRFQITVQSRHCFDYRRDVAIAG